MTVPLCDFLDARFTDLDFSQQNYEHFLTTTTSQATSTQDANPESDMPTLSPTYEPKVGDKHPRDEARTESMGSEMVGWDRARFRTQWLRGRTKKTKSKVSNPLAGVTRA